MADIIDIATYKESRTDKVANIVRSIKEKGEERGWSKRKTVREIAFALKSHYIKMGRDICFGPTQI